MQGNSSDHISRPQLYPLSLQRKMQAAFWVSIITVYLLSFLDIAGWAFNITLFKSIIPQWTPMRLITSVCFIVTSTALVVIRLRLPAILWKILPGILATFHLYNKPDNSLCISVYYKDRA